MDEEIQHCEICDKRFSGLFNVQQHYASEKHKKRFAMASDSSRERCVRIEKRVQDIAARMERSSWSAPKTSPIINQPAQLRDEPFGRQCQSSSTSDGAASHADIIRESETCDERGFGKCKICRAEYTSREQAIQHIRGKKHQKNVKQLSLTTPALGGASGLQALTGDEDESDDDCPVIMPNCKIWCDCCKRCVDTIEQYKIHCRSSKHKSKRLQLREGASSSNMVTNENSSVIGIRGESNLTSVTSVTSVTSTSLLQMRNPYNCYVCDCPLNSAEQLQIHNESKKHKNKEMKLKMYRDFDAAIPSTSGAVTGGVVTKKQKIDLTGPGSPASSSSGESEPTRKLVTPSGDKTKTKPPDVRKKITPPRDRKPPVQIDEKKAIKTIAELFNGNEFLKSANSIDSIRNNDILEIQYKYICSRIQKSLKDSKNRVSCSSRRGGSGLSKQTAKRFFDEQLMMSDVNRSLEKDKLDLEKKRDEIKLRLENAEKLKKKSKD